MTRGSINDEGVWRWTRHPNFFGEILLWFGMYVLCLAPALSGSVSESASKALYGSAVSPIFITCEQSVFPFSFRVGFRC